MKTNGFRGNKNVLCPHAQELLFLSLSYIKYIKPVFFYKRLPNGILFVGCKMYSGPGLNIFEHYLSREMAVLQRQERERTVS